MKRQHNCVQKSSRKSFSFPSNYIFWESASSEKGAEVGEEVKRRSSFQKAITYWLLLYYWNYYHLCMIQFWILFENINGLLEFPSILILTRGWSFKLVIQTIPQCVDDKNDQEEVEEIAAVLVSVNNSSSPKIERN